MSILDIDEVEQGVEDAAKDYVGYWYYLKDKDLANQSYKDIIVKAIDITRNVINNMSDCCKREIEKFYDYHKEEGTGLQIDRVNEPQHTDEQRFYYPSDNEFYETYRYPILGEYYPNDKKIILYLKAIENAVNNKYKIEYLIAIVLIHEMMHAIMDTGSMYGCYPANSLYAFWKEESYANALTLWAIHNYADKELTQQAESFMESQPDPYRYGIYLANKELSHESWKKEKQESVICEPKKQTEWLKRAQAILKQSVKRTN